MLPRSDSAGGRSEAPIRRCVRLVLVGGVAIVAIVAVGYALLLGTAPPADPPPLAAAIDPKLPDLTVGPLTGITGGLNEDGTQSVRFGVMIVNQGEAIFSCGPAGPTRSPTTGGCPAHRRRRRLHGAAESGDARLWR